MHLNQHIDKIMKIRKAVLEQMGFESGKISTADEHVIAIYVQSIVINMQSDVVYESLNNLDRPR